MNSYPEALLIATAAEWGFSLSPEQTGWFRTFADELLRWNAHTNLTSITDLEAVYVRHFLDSLALARFWGTPPVALVDLGTGAGFPGLPLKLLRPELSLTLVDSVGKKTAFLRHLVSMLGLVEVRVISGRAEAFGQDHSERERYDIVTARAVAELRVLAEYALPLLRVGGRFLAPKGAGGGQEAVEALPALKVLGGELVGVEPVALPGVEPRTVVVIAKVAPCDPRYPRAVGVPARKPL